MNKQQVYNEIKETFGIVPTFFKHIPESTLEQEWNLFKATQLEESVIPNKYKELIGLGIAAATKSLSDMVSFGAAPGLVVYEWALKGMGKLGWVAAFVYCACAALRLARFNTNLGVVDKRFFQGLPSPAAAGLIAGFIWTMTAFGIEAEEIAWGAWALALFSGLTMVSNIKFYSGKDINLRKSVPFGVVVAIVLVVVALYQVVDNLPELLFALFVIYAASGYLMWAVGVARRKPPAPPPPASMPPDGL